MLKAIDKGLMVISVVGAALVVVLLFAGPSLIGASKSIAVSSSSGGSSGGSGSSGGTAGSGATTTSGNAAGAAVFASAGCSGCHTLKAAHATGTVGPNLDDLQPSASDVESIVKSGGGAMPSFSGKLSDAQITAVATYVSSVAGH
jgi:mono/diheme cytochrome c family protein